MDETRHNKIHETHNFLLKELQESIRININDSTDFHKRNITLATAAIGLMLTISDKIGNDFIGRILIILAITSFFIYISGILFLWYRRITTNAKLNEKMLTYLDDFDLYAYLDDSGEILKKGKKWKEESISIREENKPSFSDSMLLWFFWFGILFSIIPFVILLLS